MWDPSAGWWVHPKQFSGYGSLLALRVLEPDGSVKADTSWGTHSIIPNQWQKIESARY
jgi:hypothetical protein